MVARSDLVDVRPFRTGLAILALGLMLTLGDSGGYLGSTLSGALGLALGGTGVAIVGVLALLAGSLLLTGASAGAIIRRGATAARRTLDRPPRETIAEPPELISTANAAPVPLVDAASAYPDVIGMSEPAPLIPFPEPNTEEMRDEESLFDASPAVEDYKLPDREPAAQIRNEREADRRGQRAGRPGAHPGARRLRRPGLRRRRDHGPARHPLRAPARARNEDVEGRSAQGRPLVRARDDRDPHPGADPGQAGRRRRGAQPVAEPRHARRHLRRPAADGEPARGLARQGHLRHRRLDRPRADAAHPDRRHDGLRQVRLHQHDPHVGAAARDPRRRADDPHRPEAHRAQPLRVDSRTCSRPSSRAPRRRPRCSPT